MQAQALLERKAESVKELLPHVVRAKSTGEIIGINAETFAADIPEVEDAETDSPPVQNNEPERPGLMDADGPSTELKVMDRQSTVTPVGFALFSDIPGGNAVMVYQDQYVDHPHLSRTEAVALRRALTHLLRLWPEPPEDASGTTRNAFEPDDDLPF